MARGHEILDLDYHSEELTILRFIRRVVGAAGAKGVVVGLSGGVDSAVVGALCVKALGKDRVTALILPSDFTPEADLRDAEEMAAQWGVKTLKVNISGTAEKFFAAFDFKSDRIPRANVQARVRMVLNYFVANTFGLLVAGTGDKSEDLLGYFCYDSETRVVTVNGPKGIDELKPDDVVFSLDPRTLRLREARVDDVHRFDYEGDMIHFTGRGADLLVTPNHRMLVQTSSSDPDSRRIFRTAEECMRFKDVVVPLPRKWDGLAGLPRTLRIRFTQKHIKRDVQIVIEDALYLFGLFIGDGCATKGKAIVPVKSNLTRLEYTSLPRDSGGHFAAVPSELVEVRMKEYDTYETIFSLPSYTKEGARQRLLAILNKYQIGYSLTRDTVRVPSRGIYDLFVQCGIGAKHKRIPRWLLQYPSETLVHLLRGLKDSDASHAEDQNVYYTPSDQLKDNFVELCYKLGRKASVRVREPRTSVIGYKKFVTSRSYEISFARKPRFQQNLAPERAKKVKYRGRVWCPSVPPFENILVERNGKYLFSGNTKFGDGGVDFLPIAHLYKTQVRRLGSRLGLPERVVNKPASPQLWPGHTAAEELPADYDRLDPLLYYLFDAKLSPAAAARKAGLGAELARAVVRLHTSSWHKRALPPMVRPW